MNDVCSESSESHQSTVHQPHPNIIDQLRGTIKCDVPSPAAAAGVVVADSNGDGSETTAAAAADDNSDDDDESLPPISVSDISEEFQIPKHVYEEHELKTKLQQQL